MSPQLHICLQQSKVTNQALILSFSIFIHTTILFIYINFVAMKNNFFRVPNLVLAEFSLPSFLIFCPHFLFNQLFLYHIFLMLYLISQFITKQYQKH